MYNFKMEKIRNRFFILIAVLGVLGLIALSTGIFLSFKYFPRNLNFDTTVAGALDKQESYKVTKVIDGDTVEIEYNGTIEKVRLLGIDTPEIKDPRKPVQCFGKEASGKTKELLEGEKVFIEFDESQGERDKYGRLLLYLRRESDGLFINDYLIKEGYAYEYTYNLPYKYQRQFQQSESSASQDKKGLWGTVCN
jgi:micrococcal nuclease